MRTTLTAVAVLLLAGIGSATAQDAYPTKAVEIIVPFAAGGSTDLGGRVLAQKLEAKWGVPVRIVNKPGGNTVPAVSELMRAKPDGYTLLMDGPPASSMLETVVKDLPFKVLDRTFLGVTAYTPMKFIVPYDSPFKTLKDVAAAVKSDPSSFTWTSLGGAGAQDMTFRQFFQAIGVEAGKTRAIQLKGGSEAITMTAGGHVKLGVGSYSSIAAPLNAKRIRLLAVAAPQRWPNLPDVPTTAEAGFPSVEVLYWIGVSGPPNLPPHIAKIWDEALSEIDKTDAYREGLLRIGLLPLHENAKAMVERVKREAVETKKLYGG
ncbi:tripartite tricarboxylate transporter substrate binding protein [Pseudorhodoplanes sp.]|uniref:Bug family tripartite tricarboxylate transporter substrate binding protein n=1 Tax=Pseudorhodoplanes sp. TaxID=1934341 RepID=UPI002C96786F|nr:tripartite tricarboxylate transporter substrate binding protein [Pseudorhodoplanes sp.]HWV55408.1 tripartite tricarboxylate transporter substrate binding protein [Pseudorhodoplanes sp.]